MTKPIETRLSVWTVWSYEKEEHWINAQSEHGLHLERANLLMSTFWREPSVRYTYRLDYRPDLSGGERLQEYLDLYADAGWEHTCTIVGWHYFRRPWQPGEQPVIYTDRSSLRQHYQRIQRTLMAALSINLVAGVFQVFNVIDIWTLRGEHLSTGKAFLVVWQAMLILLLAYGCVVTGRKMKATSAQ